jgi:hypothetical protein
LEIVLDVGCQTGSWVLVGNDLLTGSKARKCFVLFAVPAGFQGASRGGGFGFEGGTLEPINLGCLIEPLGRHTGAVLEKEVADWRSGFGALSGRKRDFTDEDRGRSRIECV